MTTTTRKAKAADRQTVSLFHKWTDLKVRRAELEKEERKLKDELKAAFGRKHFLQIGHEGVLERKEIHMPEKTVAAHTQVRLVWKGFGE